MTEGTILKAVVRAMHPRHIFRISRGARTEVRNVFVEFHRHGISGYGEASPNAFYGESADAVLERVQTAAPFLQRLRIESPADIAAAWRDLWPLLAPSRAAQCALDCALWDWLARRHGKTVAELAHGKPPCPVPTFCTLGISDPAELEPKIAELQGFPFIKIKSDARADLATLRLIRSRLERPDVTLEVDANCAWGEADLYALSRELAPLGVAFIEQPLPPAQDARMPERLAASSLPLFADESCVIQEDLERLPGRFSGFNIKLVKCGGLTPALAMVRRGRELGLQTMVGCMLESSLLIAAGATVAQQTDYADLDGAWLLADDPFQGLPLKAGVLTPALLPGLGVEPGESFFNNSKTA